MLLTISIPTYQRAKYLDLCLQRIIFQISSDITTEIEIIVSDNNSTDNTKEIVKKHIDNNPKINLKYFKNDTNVGLDGNITQAYRLANSRFVLVFGDDDVLIDGSIEKIYKILSSNLDAGVVYIDSFGFTGDYREKIPVDNLGEYWKYFNKKSFIKKVNYYFTYTSGNIINKSLIDSKLNVDRFLGTNLNLLNWIITGLFTAHYNIFISDRLIGTKTENTGGYGFCETFAKNGNYVFESFTKEDNIPAEYFDVINDRMIVNYLPYLINLFKENSKSYIPENYKELLTPIYKKNILYWLFCYPSIIFPRRVSGRFLYLNKWYRRFVNAKIKFIDETIDTKNGKLTKIKLN